MAIEEMERNIIWLVMAFFHGFFSRLFYLIYMYGYL